MMKKVVKTILCLSCLGFSVSVFAATSGSHSGVVGKNVIASPSKAGVVGSTAKDPGSKSVIVTK